MHPRDRTDAARRRTPVRISNWYPLDPTATVVRALRDAGYTVAVGSGWFEAVRHCDVDHDGSDDDYESAAFACTGVEVVLLAADVVFDLGVAVYTVEALDGCHEPLEFIG